jgi:uncharacterized membrane protein HdeD (DUF308 family)
MATTITREIRESATWSIVLSVLMMVTGVLAILIPPVAGLTVTVAFGWLLVVTGVLHLGFAWRADHAGGIVGRSFLPCCTARLASTRLRGPSQASRH